MMILNGRDMVDEADFVTAVPMHIEKLRKRGYNQAAILAANIAKLANKELLPDLILKHKPSKSQSGLDRIQRKENVKNTFMINPIYKDTIFRKKILLVDDVLTTGATASECAKILRNNRCKRTYLLTVARTF
jgi:predicted amidophosphoribosyltransferase